MRNINFEDENMFISVKAVWAVTLDMTYQRSVSGRRLFFFLFSYKVIFYFVIRQFLFVDCSDLFAQVLCSKADAADFKSGYSVVGSSGVCFATLTIAQKFTKTRNVYSLYEDFF